MSLPMGHASDQGRYMDFVRSFEQVEIVELFEMRRPVIHKLEEEL